MKTKDIFLKGQGNLSFIMNAKGVEYNKQLLKNMGIANFKLINFISFFSPILYVINICFAFLFISLKFLIKFFAILFSHRKKEIVTSDLFLFFAYPFYDRCKAANKYNNSIYWVIGPNVNANKFDLNQKQLISYDEYVTAEEALFAYFKSLSTIIHYISSYSCIVLVHKTYEFYLTYYNLKRIAKQSNIYFSNQSDKWASLFDYIKTSDKHLLQHGIVANWGKLPYPLDNINVFHSISNNTWQDAYDNILTKKPKLAIMNPTISLTEIDKEKTNILLVSYISMFDLEVEIIKFFQNKGYELIVKKHPGLENDFAYRSLLNEYKFNYITEKIFPKVDLVISYYSTLAYEYMAYNIPVYMYNIREEFSFEELNKYLSKLK